MVSSNSLYKDELAVTLKKISDHLVVGNTEISEGKIVKAEMSPMVDLKKPEQLFGLAERIVGVESAIFLSKQYEFLQEFLESLIPPTNKVLLQQFFTQVTSKMTVLSALKKVQNNNK